MRDGRMKSNVREQLEMNWEARQLGHAKNAILQFLEKKLVVPRMYIDASWSDQSIDVLAVDRDGVGDVHVVKLLPVDVPGESGVAVNYLIEKIDPLLDFLISIPAQYKYIAPVDISLGGRNPFPGLPHSLSDRSFSADGLGRIGFVAIDFITDGEPSARLIAKPERFRAKIAKLADEYVQQHEADWEIRA